MHRPHLHISICLCAPPPRSCALQQPSDILIHDKRDAGSRKHPDDVRGQAAIEPSYAFVRPGVCDRGWDGTVVGAREHRVVLLTFVSCFFLLFFFLRAPPCIVHETGKDDLPESVNGSLGMGMLRITPRVSTRRT